MLVDEIQSFARDFINVKSFRTSSRKAKIREAYKSLTGENIKITCNTCYIEALLTIINSKPMATRNYELKKGVLLQAFGDASKTCTNDTLTDELAQWYLKNYPEKAVFFSRILQVPVNVNPDIRIIPPAKNEPEKDDFSKMPEEWKERNKIPVEERTEVSDTASKLIESVIQPVKRSRKPKTNK
jgi:hypothetical protein